MTQAQDGSTALAPPGGVAVAIVFIRVHAGKVFSEMDVRGTNSADSLFLQGLINLSQCGVEPELIADSNLHSLVTHGCHKFINSLPAVGQRFFDKYMATAARRSQRGLRVQSNGIGDKYHIGARFQRRFQRRKSPQAVLFFRRLPERGSELGVDDDLPPARAKRPDLRIRAKNFSKIPDVPLTDGSESGDEDFHDGSSPGSGNSSSKGRPARIRSTCRRARS